MTCLRYGWTSESRRFIVAAVVGCSRRLKRSHGVPFDRLDDVVVLSACQGCHCRTRTVFCVTLQVLSAHADKREHADNSCGAGHWPSLVLSHMDGCEGIKGGNLGRPRLPGSSHLCDVEEGCWPTRDMPTRADIMQLNAGAFSQMVEKASVRKPARCWNRRAARDTRVPGALASSLTGRGVQHCRVSTCAFPSRGRCCRGPHAMLSSVGEGRTDVRHLTGLSCSCGGDAPSSGGGVPLYVVRHATSIATGIPAKIVYGARHGACIGPWPASRRVVTPRVGHALARPRGN